MPDIANPMRADGALDYVPDIWLYIERIVTNAGYAGAASAAVALILWALIVKFRPDYKPRVFMKILVTGIASPMLVIVTCYVARLMGHKDYFTLERLIAVLDVWKEVTIGTGVWAAIAAALGLDLDTLKAMLKLLFPPPPPPPAPGTAEALNSSRAFPDESLEARKVGVTNLTLCVHDVIPNPHYYIVRGMQDWGRRAANV